MTVTLRYSIQKLLLSVIFIFYSFLFAVSNRSNEQISIVMHISIKKKKKMTDRLSDAIENH